MGQATFIHLPCKYVLTWFSLFLGKYKQGRRICRASFFSIYSNSIWETALVAITSFWFREHSPMQGRWARHMSYLSFLYIWGSISWRICSSNWGTAPAGISSFGIEETLKRMYVELPSHFKCEGTFSPKSSSLLIVKRRFKAKATLWFWEAPLLGYSLGAALQVLFFQTFSLFWVSLGTEFEAWCCCRLWSTECF